LDGANIAHGGKSSDQKLDGNRLISAIQLYESKGYEVLPCLKGGTYYMMSGNAVDFKTGKKIPKAPGYDSLRKLTEHNSHPRLRTYKKDDDLHIIHLALERNAWIVTNDTFEDKTDRETKEVTTRERSNYPELDWKKIDDMTWGTSRRGDRAYTDDTWRTEGPTFLHPTLKPAPAPLFVDDDAEIRGSIHQLGVVLQDIARLSENSSGYMEKISIHAHWISERYREMSDLIPDPQIPSEEELKGKKVVELREICEILSLKKGGLKKEIIERILESQKLEETPAEEEPVSISMSLEESERGRVVGEKGATLKNIQEETGAKLWVDWEKCKLSISGRQECVEKAKEHVEKILEQHRISKSKKAEKSKQKKPRWRSLPAAEQAEKQQKKAAQKAAKARKKSEISPEEAKKREAQSKRDKAAAAKRNKGNKPK